MPTNPPRMDKIDGIRFFYMVDLRKAGGNAERRGVRYRRTASVDDDDNIFEAWSDRDEKAIWGMSTTETSMVFRLKEDHGFAADDELQVVCKNGDTTIVSYEMTIKRLHYDFPGGLSWSSEIYDRFDVGPIPGIPLNQQGYLPRVTAVFPRGFVSSTNVNPQELSEKLFNFKSSRAIHVVKKTQRIGVADSNTIWSFAHGDLRSPIQGATESMGSGDADHAVTNTNFSYDTDVEDPDFRVGSMITGMPGHNDHPKHHREISFYYEMFLEVTAPMTPIFDRAILGSSETPGGRADEEMTAFMVKGREYIVQIQIEDATSHRDATPTATLSTQRLGFTIDRVTGAGISGAATFDDGSAGIVSSNTEVSPPLFPYIAGTLYEADGGRDNNAFTGVDLILYPEDGRLGEIHANHFRTNSLWVRYVPSETGTYRINLSHRDRSTDPNRASYDLFLWGISSLSASNCPGHANDYFDRGIAPEKFVFTQHIENRIFYAREIFPSDGEGIVLQPPAEPRPKYVLSVRKEIPNTERIAIDITLSIEGARFHQPMKSEGRVSMIGPDGRSVDDISLIQVSGGNVGDKEVTFRIDNELKGKLEAGSRIEFVFPALEGVNFSKERDRVTITPTELSVVRGDFPEDRISTCLSEIAGRGCVYARSLRTGKVTLGPVNASGRQVGTVAIVDPNDFTRLIDGEGSEAVVPLDLPGSLIGSDIPGKVNAIRMGTVGFEAGIVSSSINNTCLAVYRLDSGIRPTNQFGEPLQLEYGDALNVGLSPEPTEDEGMFLMRKLTQDGKTPTGPYQRVPSGGMFSMDISRPENRKGNWEFFFVPSGNSEMEYGDAWTLNAGIDFLYPAYRDILSEPISRSVILDHEGDLGQPQARAYAIPPLSSADGAFVRIRCEVRGDECQISMECSNQSGQSWYGNLREYIPGGGTVVITPPEIAQALASTGFDPDIHWGGEVNGRLSCAFYARPDNSISMQLFVRSAGTLTNNTDVYHSE